MKSVSRDKANGGAAMVARSQADGEGLRAEFDASRRRLPGTSTVHGTGVVPTSQVGVKFRDRVVDFRRVKASSIAPNPKNWRLHPEGQKEAFRAVMDEIGFAGVVLAREKADGSGLELLDGHLRAGMAGDEEVPVVILDLNDEDAAKFLATFDPLAGMAITDNDALGALLGEISLTLDDEAAAFRKLIADAHAEIEDDIETGKEELREVPGMNLSPHEHYDYLVVLASTSHEWNVICDRLGLKPEKRRGRMGTCRAVRASKLIDVLPEREK